MTQLYYRPFRRQVNNLERRYFPDRKPFNIFCWFDENGEVFEMFGVGFSWSRSRDGGDPPRNHRRIHRLRPGSQGVRAATRKRGMLWCTQTIWVVGV